MTAQERDPKKLGAFGAPQCRCTPLVLALCVALTGLVTVGAGACMAAFMWHDTTPRSLGLALVGLGVCMIVAGGGLFIYDSCIQSLTPGQTANVADAYTVQRQIQPPIDMTATTAATRGQAMGTITNVQAMPLGSGLGRRPQSHQGTAPPPYDTVLHEDVRHRSSYGTVQQQQAVSSQARGSYQASGGQGSRITDSAV